MKTKYRRMLRQMQKKEDESAAEERRTDLWYLYILRCRDGSFYTGITKDLTRRFKLHNEGKASRYTRSRRPVDLIYQEECLSRTQALKRECMVKSYSREMKEQLVIAEGSGFC